MVSSQVKAHLDTFAELAKHHPVVEALKKFSHYLDKSPIDVISANAIHFLTTDGALTASEAVSRAQQAKSSIRTSVEQLEEVMPGKLRGRSVVVHPLGALTAPLMSSARSVRFIDADKKEIHHVLPHKLQSFKTNNAPQSLDGASMLLLETQAVTPEGIVTSQGARLLTELAYARGIPVYAVATSWHAHPNWSPAGREEVIPASALTGVISEHGIYEHDQFLARVEKSFPWL